MRKINRVHVVIAGMLAFSLLGATMIGTAHARMGDRCEFGGKGGEHYGMFFGHMAKRLGLSDAQRDKIEDIMHAHADAVYATKKEQRKVREVMRSYATSPTLDSGKVKATADREAVLMSELAVKRITAFNQAYKILTDDQKHQLAEWKDHHAWRHGDEHDSDAPAPAQ